MKVIMIRSPMSVLEKDHIGYGWTKVNFSKYENEYLSLGSVDFRILLSKSNSNNFP